MERNAFDSIAFFSQCIAHLKSVINDLRDKKFVDAEQLEILNSISTCHGELLLLKLKTERKKSLSTKYTPELKTFALTLHHYSP